MDGYTDTYMFYFFYNRQVFLQSPDMLSHSVHNIATESGMSMKIAFYVLIIYYLRLEVSLQKCKKIKPRIQMKQFGQQQSLCSRLKQTHQVSPQHVGQCHTNSKVREYAQCVILGTRKRSGLPDTSQKLYYTKRKEKASWAYKNHSLSLALCPFTDTAEAMQQRSQDHRGRGTDQGTRYSMHLRQFGRLAGGILGPSSLEQSQ